MQVGTAESRHLLERINMTEIKLKEPNKIKTKNREQIRREHKFWNTRAGEFTKPSLGARKRKRRAAKKVARASQKRNR
jgi:hypothetical protein